MKMKTLEKKIERLSEKIGTLTDEMHDRCFNERFFFNSKEHAKMNEEIERYERELKALEKEYNRKETIELIISAPILAVIFGSLVFMLCLIG